MPTEQEDWPEFDDSDPSYDPWEDEAYSLAERDAVQDAQDKADRAEARATFLEKRRDRLKGTPATDHELEAIWESAWPTTRNTT